MAKLTDLTRFILRVLHRNRTVYASIVLMIVTIAVLLTPVHNLLSVFSIYGSYGMLMYAIFEVNYKSHRTFYHMHGIRRLPFECLKGVFLFGGILIKSIVLFVLIGITTAN